MSEILVTGGTGGLGSRLVPRLIAKGHTVRVLSRRENPPVPDGARAFRGDLATGEGIDDAANGVDVIVHGASGADDAGIRGVLSSRATLPTDVEGARRLLGAARRSGKTRFVYPSIVGVDRIPLGYYQTKLACEHVIEQSGVPYAIFRSTQWHTFGAEVARRLPNGPVVVLPKGFSGQLLDPGEVADRIVSLIEDGAAGHVTDMGGPVVLTLREIIEKYLGAVGKRKTIVEVPLPGKAMRALRAGYNLTPEHADGTITFDEWLAANVKR
jgi:uncharacterized protein YbjT (DUF2867 family)